MGVSGHRLTELLHEHRKVDLEWRERAGNYWHRFIQDLKEKDFKINFNDKMKTVEILKENKKILSLHFTNEMLKEDVDIRYSMEIADKYLLEELEKGKEVRYNGRDWKIVSTSGDWVRIETISGEKNIKIHRDVLLRHEEKKNKKM